MIEIRLPTTLRNQILLLLAFLCFCSLLGCLFMAYLLNGQYNQNAFMKAAYHQNQRQLAGVKGQLEQVRDTLGRERTTKVILEGRVKDYGLAVATNQALHKQLSQFAGEIRDIKKAVKTFRSVTSLNVTSQADFIAITRDTLIETYIKRDTNRVTVIDTLRHYAKWFNHTDSLGWFTLAGMLDGNQLKVSKLEVKNQFDIAQRRQRRPRRPGALVDLPPFLRRRETTIEVINQNPHTHTENVQSFIIR